MRRISAPNVALDSAVQQSCILSNSRCVCGIGRARKGIYAVKIGIVLITTASKVKHDRIDYSMSEQYPSARSLQQRFYFIWPRE